MEKKYLSGSTLLNLVRDEINEIATKISTAILEQFAKLQKDDLKHGRILEDCKLSAVKVDYFITDKCVKGYDHKCRKFIQGHIKAWDMTLSQLKKDGWILETEIHAYKLQEMWNYIKMHDGNEAEKEKMASLVFIAKL